MQSKLRTLFFLWLRKNSRLKKLPKKEFLPWNFFCRNLLSQNINMKISCDANYWDSLRGFEILRLKF